MKIAVLASGRGSNLQAFIDAWQAGHLPGAEFVAVGSDQRGAAALEKAAQAGIPHKEFPLQSYGDKTRQEADILRWLNERHTELLILAGYMRVLSADFITRALFPIQNIHPSLLPAFPGLH
ncbi:MAG: phosphoribosylglycinamide formyltransferase, partial [Peptococcaceae bacterium]|nr:phosphoribosylglycinamide formyltransferase [Peptococcaceae bacterium]